MARMPGADWRPVVNVHRNGVREHRGLVLHVQDDTTSPYGWFNNPASQASSDFWVSEAGHIEQYCETGTDYAWTQAAGNPYYASVETEGHPADPLTAAQVEAVARIYAWGHGQFGWPLAVVDSTTEHGLTYHGVGGAAWGGHTGCPGDKRKAQRAAIIARATELVTPKPPTGPPGKPPAYTPFPGAAWFSTGRRSPIVAAMHDRLVAAGCNRYTSSANKDVIGSGDVASYEAWQRKYSALHGKGWSGAALTWPPGRETWDALKVPHA